MDYIVKKTIGLFDILLYNHNPKQKAIALRFIHGLFLILLLILFIFSPGRSVLRYFALSIFIFLISMYFYFGSCWWTVVEQHHNKTDDNVMDVLITLIGLDINDYTRETITRTIYLMCFFFGLFLIIRDIIGIY